jgi:hypothetical protein
MQVGICAAFVFVCEDDLSVLGATNALFVCEDESSVLGATNANRAQRVRCCCYCCCLTVTRLQGWAGRCSAWRMRGRGTGWCAVGPTAAAASPRGSPSG